MRRLIILPIMLWSLVSCQSSVPKFDENAAFDNLLKQCEFGPRNPGSEGHSRCKSWLIDQLQVFADTVFTQPFTYRDLKEGREHRLTNIIARFNPDNQTHLLLGAHWDTRPWADWDPYPERRNEAIIGANDGASGVAVLLEIARILHEHPRKAGITIVLFDGEDLGVSGVNESYANGAQYFARNLPIPVPRSAIVLDMIGDTELTIPIERNSYRFAPGLVKTLWQLADKLNLPAFESRLGDTIYDDHVPLWEYAGIPAVDLIDFHYPTPGENFWHTHDDVPENCSPASLGQVGTLLVEYIWIKTND
ncbi:MAG: M28 family peptidase [Fidelibacterota bacterium]